ncbi:glycerophosphocholine phosphodiesterase GPCPD1 [Agrilus planipennis]|uniref:Glycerophosphocholine phosphodiesterase GPCPD1 n=1 Tax=Agrilus planipennis TaxID=224129 RepID=A0A1W4WEM6_AGRPL|nr:glycerophosphocholine phosphodiesterase GPCPD1 [Agrilus planipennis]XP_018318907.1 glycerophosphocholine phosphodiesterase GPCPD1 [Agrilus planipennis]XP_018318908.1 glycerophosphocholine phosphodiesterase GPCPD1 [Agrilus planipennis]XP_018318909.1 glycerophosphocholine phosphodiesterase GPCPD1 [Agrilus planipennis]
MQKWFFLENPENDIMRDACAAGRDAGAGEESSEGDISLRKWLFRVRVPDLKCDEVVCVVGDCQELGTWQPEKCIKLNQERCSEIWSKIVYVPKDKDCSYRYCVCVIVEEGLQVIVRNWETNLEPRKIRVDAKSPTVKEEPQAYGDYDNSCRIDKGWLIKETTVQLKLFQNISIWRPRYANRKIYIKVTPINLTRTNANFPKTMAEALEESLSTENNDIIENPSFSYTEVCKLQDPICSFQPQSQFGVEYQSGDLIIFQSTILFPQNTAFLIDLYIYSTKAVDDDPPYHAGFSYLLPSALQSSAGSVILPVTSTKHRPLGQIELEYLVVRPMSNYKCDMSVSYTRYWRNTWCGLDVGHRGSGSSFKCEPKNCAEVRENTIASLKTAIDHGADMVEFDVQLSKDGVPIIYHDYHVCISMKKKKELDETDMLELPIKELTLEQLRLLKVYHLSEGKSKMPRFFDDDLEEHQPFPTLRQLMDVLDPHTGFNIEIKWTMKLQDGSYELNHPIDLNLYLDTIIEVAMSHGYCRKIIFSSFNPDICTMIKLKQNKYPVLFLTQGETTKYPPYMDPRCISIAAAVQQATLMELLGVNVHSEDILRNPSQVNFALQANLVIFCWGDENADKGTIKYLKDLGLHGIIYDKIYEYSSKEVKESIFMVEARESQKELIQLAAATTEQSQPPQEPIIERILDVAKIRADFHEFSTATSLESLESRIEECKKENINGQKSSSSLDSDTILEA